MNKTVLWDFDGTLAMRSGQWSGVLLQVLSEYELGCHISIEDVRPHLAHGFPWHTPEVCHPHLCDPAAWWESVEAVLARACENAGVDSNHARKLARLAHERYIDSSGFVVFGDALPALEELRTSGWKHVILSNNFPELPDVIRHLPISEYISACINSAATGYEKPHPAAFKIALAAAGNPEQVWMVGDNPVADIKGADAAGIPAILARTAPKEKVSYYAPDLTWVVSIIKSADGQA
jgi:putative hydrolase of the HAD superfamily